jgi:hypothetical protein
MECITDVYGFAAKVESALLAKLGSDTNPVAARFNIIVVEISKSLELVRNWSGIIRRATTDPVSRLTNLEEFKLMTSFVQRFCRAFVEKHNEVSRWLCMTVGLTGIGSRSAVRAAGEQEAVRLGIVPGQQPP